MGHANVENLSRLFLKDLEERGSTSIKDCVDIALKKDEAVHASEGDYFEDYMLAITFEEIFYSYEKRNMISPNLTDLEKLVWDKLDEEDEADRIILDNVRWSLNKEELSNPYYEGEIPILRNISN